MHRIRDTVRAAWMFLVFIAAIMGLVVIWRSVGVVPEPVQAGLGLVVIVVLVVAGWKWSRVDRLGLVHIALAGAVLSLGTAWALPIFHDSWTIPVFAGANAAIYGFCAVVGGLLEGIWRRLKP